MTVACRDVAALVDHEASLVNVNILTALILAHHQLNLALVIAIKYTHDFL